MPVTLRPLSTVEVLDSAWLLLRRSWPRMYAWSTVGTLPLALLLLAYFRWLGTLVGEVEAATFYQGTFFWAVAMSAAWALNGAARAIVVAVSILETRGELTQVPGRADLLRYAGRGAVVGLAAFSGAWLAASCLAAPGLWLAASWWVALPSLVDEGRTPAGALRRSWRLLEGHRGRAFGLWALFALLWAVGVFGLHLAVQFFVHNLSGFLGIDTSGFAPYLSLRNPTYVLLLLVTQFVLLDPLKNAADTALYLDLRIRREGADLHDRLRQLKAAGASVLALVLLLPGAAHAVTPEEYLREVRQVREHLSRAPSADKVDRSDLRRLRDQVVTLPGGQKVTVENDWLDGARAWDSAEEKQAVLRKLEAVERSLGGVAWTGRAVPPAGAAGGAVSAKEALGQVLAQPEFQPLAGRAELRDLVRVDSRAPKGWWKSFSDWLNKTLFKPQQPNVKAPNWSLPGGGAWLEPLLWIVLAAAVIAVVVLFARWLVERPLREAGPAVATAAAPPLEASATENALDHTVDEWELFAQQWLGQGDARQAVRALYLATLVHLHRQRRIDYNRALTNWVYVRQFRGEPEAQGTLRRLTRMFDEVWYGGHACDERSYREFERGVRELGTPPPGMGAARA
ncbi:MAG: DUF4129 domain-containing protein [Armatimonadota bacterium]